MQKSGFNTKRMILQDITNIANNCGHNNGLAMETDREKTHQVSNCSYVNFKTLDRNHTPFTPDQAIYVTNEE